MKMLSNYDVVMTHKDGKYRAYLKALQLVGSGETPDLAIAMIEEKYDTLFAELEDAGFKDDLLPTTTSDLGHSFFNSSYFLKLLSAVVAIALVFYVAALSFNSIVNKVEMTAYSMSNTVSLRPLLVKLRQEIMTLSDRSPEQQQEVIDEVRKLVAIIRPYADEIAPLFNLHGGEICECAKTTPDTGIKQ